VSQLRRLLEDPAKAAAAAPPELEPEKGEPPKPAPTAEAAHQPQ
jgi:hypothetical protein